MDMPMSALDAIFARRSIRRYTDEPVLDQDVETLLHAAMAAPSAGNAQTWEFVVIRDRMLLHAAADAHPYAKMAREADVAILVCGNTSREKYEGFWVQDCAAAVQNLLVAVAAQGLGAVWTGVYPHKDRTEAFTRIFGLPAGVIPLAFIPLGHPAETKGSSDRYDPAKVHRNRWSGA